MEENIETNEEVETTENTQNNEQENTTYTQSELDRQISKAVESAIAKRDAKHKEELEERLERERNEAIEYAKLTEKEKQEKRLQKREEELAKREQELNNKQLLNEIESDLKENSLPVSFAPMLLQIQDNEKIKESITSIKSEFDSAVNEMVKEKLRQDTPRVTSAQSTSKVTSIADMAKQNRIIK